MKFQPGQSGNPSGRPKGVLTALVVQQCLSRFWMMSPAELEALLADPATKMGDRIVAQVMKRAEKDGDYNRLSFLLDRMIGRPKELGPERDSLSVEEALSGIPLEEVVNYLRTKSHKAA